MKKRQEKCELCRFVLRHERPRTLYLCRRYPPQVFVTESMDEVSEAFPEVQPEEWCGEFQS